MIAENPWPHLKGRRHPPNVRSRGHIHSINRHKLRDDAAWVYLCWQCNNDQGNLSLDEWLLILRHRGDPRADRVEQLVGLLKKEDLL